MSNMQNIWMRGQRSSVLQRSLGSQVQTEESLVSDAWLSRKEEGGVSADINPNPVTFNPQFQLQYLPRSGVM